METPEKQSAENSTVNLLVKGSDREKSFPESQALALLKVRNSQWELKDDKYLFANGELSKNPKQAKKEAAAPSADPSTK